jgi:tetratricopeptide (TPR) repeat protein
VNREVIVRSFGFVLSACALFSIATGAAAEEQDSPGRVLFKAGRALAAEGDHLAACSKFEQSLKLEPGIGTQFNLADCWEHLGRYASAQSLFLKAAAEAKSSGQADREQVLRDRAFALAPVVNKLVIEVKDGDPKLVVKRDEVVLGPEELGHPLAVDPGKYEIVASAPNKQTWTQTVQIKPKQDVVTVVVPELKPEAPAAVVPPKAEPALPQAGPANERAPAAPTATSERPGSDRFPEYKVLGLAGLGVGALIFGTVEGLRYRSANEDAKQICPTSINCSQRDIADHQALVDKASSARTYTYIGLIGGVVSLSGAAALYFWDHSREAKPAARIRAVPIVAAGEFYGTVVSGAF